MRDTETTRGRKRWGVYATGGAIALSAAGALWVGRDGASVDGSTSSADGDDERPAPARCGTTVVATSLPETPAPPFVAPRSTLVVVAQAPVDGLVRLADARLPRTLDAATRRPVGAAGELSYRVTRGRPSVRIREEELIVDVPISAAVEICKPLGPLCPTYGRCQPQLSSRTVLNLRPGADWILPPPSLAVTVGSGCTVAGIDATARVVEAAATGKRRAQAEVNAALKQLPSLVDRGVAWLSRPRQLGASAGCWRLRPTEVNLRLPTTTEGTLTVGATLAGTVGPAACDDQEIAVPRPPLALREDQGPDEGALRWARVLPFVDLKRQLDAADVDGVATVHAVRPHGMKVAMDVTFDGATCGRTWIVATPRRRGAILELASDMPEVTFTVPIDAAPAPTTELDALEDLPGLSVTAAWRTLDPELAVTPDGIATIVGQSHFVREYIRTL
ncbi:MAG: DUF4403 family protein [Myxococcota bacterium]